LTRYSKKFESLPAILVASSHFQDGDVQDSTSTGQPAWQRTCSGSDQGKPSWQHLPRFIEPLSAKTLSTGHLEFLEGQHAFELPSWSLQKALIEAYVEYAYPYMPLIQLPDFLDSLENVSIREGKKHSLLLYLALLFAGAAFVSQSALKADTMGFSTRKLARRELSRRVTVRTTQLVFESLLTCFFSCFTTWDSRKTGWCSHKQRCSCLPGQMCRTTRKTAGIGWASPSPMRLQAA
jgi:hypothetical protein